MPRGKKKSQTRLTFEPVGASSSSPGSARSPAKVRYTKSLQSSPPRRRSSMTSSSPARVSPSSSMGNSKQTRLRSSNVPPPASFLPNWSSKGRPTTVIDSSDESAAEIADGGYDDDNVDRLPPTQKASDPNKSDTGDLDESEEEPVIVHPRSSQSVSTRLQRAIILDDSDEEVQEREISPRKRRRSSVISLDDSDDDAPILPQISARKVEAEESDDSDEVVVSPTKRRKMRHLSSPSSPVANRTPGRLKRPNITASSPVKGAHRGHRSEKQKKMELLRRRRAGERIDKLTSSESSASEDETKRGIYDSDPENEFEVLKEFDDDDEEEDDIVAEKPRRKTKPKPKPENTLDQDDEEGDLDDFVTDDDDAPLGAPLDIPLEFTSQAHLPMKDQFPHVIEWLVHNRINPAFERKDPVYLYAWRKLDDEVSGLARSKFTSSVWKPDFNRSLKARPRLDAFELRMLGSDELHARCEACGRANHPSTWRIRFSGSAYHKDTLMDVESESESESDGNSDTASVDTQGMPLAPTTKDWNVGVVCHDNAVTAHSLFHWKHALMEFVEDRLEVDGWMTAAKLREREKMKAKKRRALANGIVDGWQSTGVVSALYADFKRLLDSARNQTTTRKSRGGRW
ncbi:hypothetical protein GGS20DRAFT_103982 [Poronia punctata]|nr:hypothetical protein GGS20DRAFT_103982 [Poronia punctata]